MSVVLRSMGLVPIAAAAFAADASVAASATTSAAGSAAVPALLVVETTTGFRHTSIHALEEMLARIAKDGGPFTIDVVRQPAHQPKAPGKSATAAEVTAFTAAEADWEKNLAVALAKLSPEGLKPYAGVVFASTSGELPFPDPAGFLAWIRQGHAFIGIHAASDTFHQWPGFIDMLGGEFDHHGAQVGVTCRVADHGNPATSFMGDAWAVDREEIYQFKHYDRAQLNELLVLDHSPEGGAPGHYPVSWCRSYGDGRVFYTSLGHRQDLIDPDPGLKDRINSVDQAAAFQRHVRGGILWTLHRADDPSHP